MASQDRLEKQSDTLWAYLESIMARWNEYLANNFSQDELFVGQSVEAKTLLASDTNLRARVYDANGDFLALNAAKDADILTLAKALRDDYIAATRSASDLNTRYGTGTTLSEIRSSFRTAQEKKIKEYQSDLASFLQGKLNTSLLSEQNHAQNLALIETEEKLLQNRLSLVTSAEYSRTLVDAFSAKLDSIVQKDSALDILTKTRHLKYKYGRVVLQRHIEETTSFVPYYSSRTKLDASMYDFITAFATRQTTPESARLKLTQVSDKIATLVANGALSVKKQYQLLVLRSNILKYLENATK